jgi:hypothetical protein
VSARVLQEIVRLQRQFLVTSGQLTLYSRAVRNDMSVARMGAHSSVGAEEPKMARSYSLQLTAVMLLCSAILGGAAAGEIFGATVDILASVLP